MEKGSEGELFHEDEFSKMILSWSLHHIFNQDMFKNKVENIPLTFVSEEGYFASFVYPLLEETRSELASSLEILYKAPFADILSFKESTSGENMLYDVRVSCWRNLSSEYHTLAVAGDLLLLVDGKPESFSDLKRVGRKWALSLVKSNEDTTTEFRIKASQPIEFQDGMIVVFVKNLATPKRIWDSLHTHRNLNIIKEVLYSGSTVKEKCNICSFGYDDFSSKRLDPQVLLNLNESQRAAVMAALCKTQCCHVSFVEQIWGPPGTGKTMTVSVLLFFLLQMKQRALSCAPTNVAIVQLASRVLSLVRESFKTTTASGDYICSVGDLLLFGSKEILKVDTDVEEIYLEHRVERLAECLGPLTGWKHCIEYMIDLLENCVSQYYNFIESEFLKEKQLSNENDDKRTMLEIKSFIEFVQERFNSSGPPLRRCILTFCTHISRSFIGECNFQNMISLLDNLSSLESLLFQKNLVSEELEDLFNCKPLEDDIVLSCLSLLKTLQKSLKRLALPRFSNKYAITQFCFERGSVIFCTTASSYKLHAINMEPLNIVVIDEAAQLKEAESTIPLQLPGVKHAILIGDERQLPAVVNSTLCVTSGFGRSLFDRLSSLGHSKHLLSVQYRMHPSISFFPNLKFYHDQILDAQNVSSKSYEKRHCLWILGNERTLTNSESIWKELVCDARSRHCLFDADADECLKMTIIATKKELEQLDDLVNGNSVLFKHAKWKVLFSDDFRRSFGKLTGSRLKKQVLNLLLKLSSGWRPKNRSIDSCCKNSSQILKHFKVEGLYVVCTIDIIKEAKYVQVLKVWDVLALDKIPNLTKRLESIFSAYTDAYIRRCTEKCLEGTLEVPSFWPASQEIIKFRYLSDSENESKGSVISGDARNYVENSKVSESLLLMKFYSLSRGVVSHLLSGKEVDLPMQVTDEQMDIILSPKSSFIIGRSGTGKTTILTMKLFQCEQKFRIASEGNYEGENSRFRGAKVLHQLFVTVSPKLCYAVKQNISHLTSVSSSVNSSAEINLNDTDVITSEVNDIPDTFINIPVKCYPLVITFHRFLMMLDGTLGNSFFERFIEAREGSHGNSISSRSVALQTFIRLREVTFDRFGSLYWPHFNSSLTKKLDPSRVFTEIISHIKGGLQAGECSDGKLSYEGYCLLAESRSSTLTKEKRKMVYTIYETYEKMKIERREFDLGDLVSDIHHRLKNGSYEGDKMDLVYIDEVQDLSMRQISLFKYICQNVNEGFIFAGDTAQTIARGIDFRFQDIRSLFYKEFLSTRTTEKQEKGVVSEIFQLKQNFRTHAAVLDLAQSVIDIIYHYFIHSIDKLEPEISLISGEAPVLLESGRDENPIVTIFGDTRTSGEVVGFGADQVILVRDNGAKTEICEYVGKHALDLTILECKGLEFQDVLLYNFFGTSPLKDQWRVIHGYMKKHNLLNVKLPQSFPTFDEARHTVLYSELKQLYVAITRTRQRLWICENKEELSKSMFEYWKMRGLVQMRKLDDSVAQAMQVPSSPQEWQERGKKLFYENSFVMAALCFEKTGDMMWEKLAKACGRRASADQIQATHPESYFRYLRKAAGMFESIGKLQSAASCYCDLGEYERAGKIFMDKCGKLDAAAECFTLAGCYNEAAEAYAKGDQFSNCLSVCKRGNLLDKGRQYIVNWIKHPNVKSNELEEVEQQFLESCALNYHEHKDSNSMLKFVRAFCSMESKRTFLRSLGCLDELLLLEEESGHFAEAAELARSWGDLLKEADLLEKAGQFKESGLFELKILSDQHISLPELKKDFYVSQKNKSLTGDILSIRKILDKHLYLNSSKYDWEDDLPVNIYKHCEDKMFQNRVSVRTLVFYWNLWKKHVMDIFRSIKDLENEVLITQSGHADFCLYYFGVRKLCEKGNMVYLSLNKDADWIRNTGNKGFRRDEKRIQLDARELVFAIRSNLESELLSVGIKVLETLDALLSGDLVSLRDTDLSVNLVDEIILRNVDIKGDLTNRETGRAMMIFLGSRTSLKKESIKGLHWNSKWKPVVKYLRSTDSVAVPLTHALE
ncbi:UvrD-like helicase, ATP-binding domain, P-loop containing nucleoside triphosphate hydrolase [Tanacetum coccineum]